MKKIKIVTALFDINRSNSPISARTNEEYFTFFKFWCRIQNEMIVYCDPSFVNRISEIRAGFGLLNKTTIIPVNSIFDIERKLYNQMCNIEAKSNFHMFRYRESIENTASYCYLTMIKAWCLQDAASKSSDECFLAWVDFGFYHGGKKYIRAEDFDFEWSYPFDNKINAFCLRNPDEVSSIDTLQFLTDCFIGGLLVLPSGLCGEWWNRILFAMHSLVSLDCIDDEQQLMLMIYKMYPDDFTIRICDWFDGIAICSNISFTTESVTSNITPGTAQNEPIFKKLSFKFKLLIKTFILKYIIHENKPHPYTEQTNQRIKNCFDKC